MTKSIQMPGKQMTSQQQKIEPLNLSELREDHTYIDLLSGQSILVLHKGTKGDPATGLIYAGNGRHEVTNIHDGQLAKLPQFNYNG